MGSVLSSNKKPMTPIPQYSLPGEPPMPYGTMRPGTPINMGMGGASPLNRRQQQQLMKANQTIQNLQNQIAMQRGGRMSPSPMTFDGPPIMNAPPPMPYGGYPGTGQPPSYPPRSPLLQRFPGQSSLMGPGGFRDSDYAAVANISGLNPADVALLHREYTNLTRSGRNKLDRVVFRQLLREALVEANNENVDRAIENIFMSIDRNHDGFIDFPEFVGAFRDVLKGNSSDSQNFFAQQAFPDLFPNQLQPSAISSNIPQPITYVQQPQPAPQVISLPSTGYQQAPQIISLPSTGYQQAPLVCNSAPPLVISLDSNQSPFVINGQGYPLTAQPAGLQYMSI